MLYTHQEACLVQTNINGGTMKQNKDSHTGSSGERKRVLRRVPRYVHSPEVVRQLVRVLGGFDSRSQQALFWQAQYLLQQPANRTEKCLRLSSDPEKNWAVVRGAVGHLLNCINSSVLHPYDRDRTIDLFLLLRRYTFDIPFDQLSLFLTDSHRLPSDVRRYILKTARKVAKGITPRRETHGPIWDSEVVDGWLEQAENS